MLYGCRDTRSVVRRASHQPAELPPVSRAATTTCSVAAVCQFELRDTRKESVVACGTCSREQAAQEKKVFMSSSEAV